MTRLSALLLAALDQGGSIITADAHQAFQLRLAWAEHQRRAGLESWPSPDIVSLQAALTRLARRALLDDAHAPLLLSPAQERTLWEQVVAVGPQAGLLQPHGTGRAVQRAWKRLHDWRIDPEQVRNAGSEEARSFARWAHQFDARCHAGNFLDMARASVRLAVPDIDRGRPCVFAGFDRPAPAIRALAARWSAAGLQVSFDAGCTVRESRVARAACSDRQDEWLAAARWARARLLAEPAQRLLIIIPDLEPERDRIERLFDEVLRPAALLNARVGGQVPYAIEGGIALSAYPLVANALSFVALLSGVRSFDLASEWWRSVHLEDAERRASTRARLDAMLREKADHELDFAQFAEALERAARRLRLDDPLIARMARLTHLGRVRQGLAAWSTQLNAALGQLGWPGPRVLDSAQRQTLDKFHDLLGELALLDDLVGPVDARGLQHHLRALAEQTRFQPETGDAPLTLSARLADPAMAYDGLWVCGLDANAWPRAARPDPFLPVELQRAAGVPEASAAGMLERAQRLTACWASRADEVVFSWARRVEGDEALPSPLIAQYPGRPELEALATGARSYWESVRDPQPHGPGERLEELLDQRGPPLAPGAPLLGGSHTLTLQSLCAVRAFATRRLGAQPLRHPDSGIDARTRGVLTHEALAAFWEQVRSQQRLLEMDAAERTRALTAAVHGVMQQTFPVPLPRFAVLEARRLLAVLEEWLQIEIQRPPFAVVRSEVEVAAEVAGRALDLRIDRIDRHADGRHQVLDYKTGELRPAAWLGDRPDDVQLPLYAVALDPTPDGVAVAQLRARKCALLGESSEPSLTGGRSALAWPAQLANWRAVIGRLVEEFGAGDARVNPKDGLATCRTCHLHAFCRIDEILARDPDEDAEAEDE